MLLMQVGHDVDILLERLQAEIDGLRVTWAKRSMLRVRCWRRRKVALVMAPAERSLFGIRWAHRWFGDVMA